MTSCSSASLKLSSVEVALLMFKSSTLYTETYVGLDALSVAFAAVLTRSQVPLSRVKFDARHEYEYVQNFKVLQMVFDKHKIDNAIPVERLSKCKMQGARVPLLF